MVRDEFPPAWIRERCSVLRQRGSAAFQWVRGAAALVSSRGLQIIKDTSRKTFNRLRAMLWQTMAYRRWKLILEIGVVILLSGLLISAGLIVWNVPQWQLGPWLHWDWLIPLLTVVGTILLRLSSTPEHPRLAYLAAGLLIICAITASASAWRNSRARLALQEYTYAELQSSTGSLLGLISQIIVYASDGWLPSNQNEIFSAQVATLVCWHLNIEARAPVFPQRDWLTWIAQETKAAHAHYTAILSAHASSMDEELIRVVRSARDSFFLKHPSQWVVIRRDDQQLGYQRPSLLCPGLESLVEQSLSHLATLYHVLWSRTGSKPYPTPTEGRNPNNLRNELGRARFSAEDLARWEREHPYAPSGKPPN